MPRRATGADRRFSFRVANRLDRARHADKCGPFLEQRLDSEFDTEQGLDLRDELDAAQRIPAKEKEVVVWVDVLDLEQRGPKSGKRPFERRQTPDLFRVRRGSALSGGVLSQAQQLRKCMTAQFAVVGAWQTLDEVNASRHLP